MQTHLRLLVLLPAAVVATAYAAGTVQQPIQQPSPPPQQPSAVELVITGDPGTPPRYAVPDFVALGPDAAEAARTVAAVLWDDLDFEREFYMIPRDISATVRAVRVPEQINFADWREIGADAVVVGTASRAGTAVTVQVRLFNVRSQQAVFSREYTGTNVRLIAHTIADEIHLQQRGLNGVARTKLSFVSDRIRERVTSTVEARTAKEIYIADYDGANQRRITSNRQLNGYPSWAPDARSIAYTGWRFVPGRGDVPDIFVSHLYEGRLVNVTGGRGNNYVPAYSPDGRQIAFMSNRDGNPEIYVMNADGSNVRRLTNHPAGESAPTWSPSGAQIAFTSDRAGQPQIYIMSADGTGVRRLTTAESYADRASWSPTTNEIAFTARNGPAYDIKVYNLSTGQTRQVTFGEGTNESPAFSPNGRHIAFMSTRGSGRWQIYTVGADGRGLRQITRDGNNQFPAWSR